MILKSRRLFYVPAWHPDPVNAVAAGLWFRDTRFLDGVRVDVAGATPEAEMLAVERDRTVTRHGPATITLTLGDTMSIELTVESGPARILLSADFKDIFELRGWVARGRGQVLRPEVGDGIHLGYRARDGHRLSTSITHTGELEIVPTAEGVSLLAPGPGTYRIEVTPGALPAVGPPRPVSARISTDNPTLDRLMRQGVDDLLSLETEFPDGVMPAAGLPWYMAPFGRDALIVSWQTLHLDPWRAAACLRTLASLQGRKVDPATGEEPGKIIHEARYGELARLGEIPHRPYYGSVDSTPLFLMVAADTIAWGAEPGLARELAPAIDAAVEWVTGWGDPDGDGLIEYPLRDLSQVPPLVARHQSWKDSTDSLHYPDGTEPEGPIAPVEVQGYAHRALRTFAAIARADGDIDRAGDLEAKAEALAGRINGAYWLGDWYAQALDGARRPVDAISSNGAQLLFSGAVPPDRAESMVERMLRPDLWSGWGVRTLGTGMADYDPLSYHNGSVWPHDNGIIADGCYLTGHPEAGEEIFEAMLGLAASHPDGSPAELYSGEAGDAPPSPVPGSCRPQAWAAGTIPQILRSSLGLRVAGDTLVLSPALPSFIDRVIVEGVTALGTTGDLRVERDGSGYRVESEGLPVRVSP